MSIHALWIDVLNTRDQCHPEPLGRASSGHHVFCRTCVRFAFIGVIAHVPCNAVGAMFYLSPTLTFMMLGIVPPVSLGAVSFLLYTCLQHGSWSCF